MLVSGWPFPCVIRGDLSKGNVADIVIRIPAGVDGDALNRFIVCGSAFWELAGFGAFCGLSLKPEKSTASMGFDGVPMLIPGLIHWRVENIKCDQRAMATFFNLLFASELYVDSVEVKAHGRDHVGTLTPYNLCGPGSKIQRAVPSGTEKCIGVNLDSSCDENVVEALIDLIESWALVTGMGGFPSDDANIEPPHLTYKEPPAFKDNAILFRVQEKNLSPKAYGVLFNMFKHLQARSLPIQSFDFV